MLVPGRDHVTELQQHAALLVLSLLRPMYSGQEEILQTVGNNQLSDKNTTKAPQSSQNLQTISENSCRG